MLISIIKDFYIIVINSITFFYMQVHFYTSLEIIFFIKINPFFIKVIRE